MTISLIHILLACVAILGLGFVVVVVRVKSMAGQLASIQKAASTFTEHYRMICGLSDSIGHLEAKLRRLEDKPSLAPADPDELRPDEVQYWREKLADLQHNAELYGLHLEYTLTIDPDA